MSSVTALAMSAKTTAEHHSRRLRRTSEPTARRLDEPMLRVSHPVRRAELRTQWCVASLTKLVLIGGIGALVGSLLAGCGSAPASAPAPKAEVGYIAGTALPCVGVGGMEPQANIELEITGPASARFSEPTRWNAGAHRFRFSAKPGVYRIYEEQRFSNSFERVGGPFTVRVVADGTTSLTVGNGCK